MGHNKKDWGERGRSVRLCCLVGTEKFPQPLQYPEGWLPCVILLLAVYVFPLSVKQLFVPCRVTQRKDPKKVPLEQELNVPSQVHNSLYLKERKAHHVLHVQCVYTARWKSSSVCEGGATICCVLKVFTGESA